MKEKTLVLVPSGIECEFLVPDSAEPISNTPFRAWRDGPITWAICGVGSAAAAMTATSLLSALMPDRVVLAGIAGAFKGSGLALSQVVQVANDEFADLGFQEEEFWVGLDDIHLPVLQTQEKDFGCRFQVMILDRETPSVAAITLNRITASVARANELQHQFGAAVEQMEGAGVALACAFAEIPFYHVRSISNWVGPRDPSTWQTQPACEALNVWLGEHL